MLVERLKESKMELYRPALESLRTLIRTSTSSMTSVPKPLKFLRPHYPALTELFQKWPDSDIKVTVSHLRNFWLIFYQSWQCHMPLKILEIVFDSECWVHLNLLDYGAMSMFVIFQVKLLPNGLV